jgi:hypothetical protein
MLSESALITKIQELTKGNPKISRRELAQACGFGRGLKSDIEAFENATLAATGILPTETTQSAPASRSVFPVSPKGLVCVRRGWLQKIGANAGDSIKINWNSQEAKIEITKVEAISATTPVVDPVENTATEPSFVAPSADLEVPASPEVVSVAEEPVPAFDLIPVTFSVAELTDPELEESIKTGEENSADIEIEAAVAEA